MSTPEREIERLRLMNQGGLLGVQAAQGQLPGGLLGPSAAAAPPALPQGATPPLLPPTPGPQGLRTAPQSAQPGQPQPGPAGPIPLAPIDVQAQSQFQPQVAQSINPRDRIRDLLVQNVSRVTGSTDLKPSTLQDLDEAANDIASDGPPEGNNRRGWLDRLLGTGISGLTEAQNRQLKRDALIGAGLTMLAAPAGTPALQALATGVLAARQSAAMTAGELLDERQANDRLRRYGSVFADSDLGIRDQYEEMRKLAIRMGDEKAVDQATDILNEINDRPEEANRELLKTDAGLFWVDNEASEVFDLDGNPIASTTEFQEMLAATQQPETQIVDGQAVRIDPATGQATASPIAGFRQEAVAPKTQIVDGQIVAIDPSGRATARPIEGFQQAAAGATKDQQDAAATALQMRQALADLRGREGAPFGAAGRLISLLPREMEPADLQQFKAATTKLGAVITRAMSGASASDREFLRSMEANIPTLGDKPEVFQQKMADLEEQLAQLEQRAGPALPDQQQQLPAADIQGSAGRFRDALREARQ